MAETQIEWTDATWNPVAGCSIVSAGCTNCYAMEMAKRLEAMRVEKYVGLTRRSGNRTIWNGTVKEDRAALDIPRKWKKARKIFVNSMSDLFHEQVSDEFILSVWQVMRETPRHSYQILTKRPDRMASLIPKCYPTCGLEPASRMPTSFPELTTCEPFPLRSALFRLSRSLERLATWISVVFTGPSLAEKAESLRGQSKKIGSTKSMSNASTVAPRSFSNSGELGARIISAGQKRQMAESIAARLGTTCLQLLVYRSNSLR